MKVYIIFQNDMECSGSYTGKVFDSKSKAKSYIEPKNKEIYDGWLEFAKTYGSEYIKYKIEEYGSAEGYAKHMTKLEQYYYCISEVE